MAEVELWSPSHGDTLTDNQPSVNADSDPGLILEPPIRSLGGRSMW